MSKLYGLIFDVDGLIANTEPVNAKVTIRVFEDMFGVRGVRPEDFAAGIGRGAEVFIRAAADAGRWMRKKNGRNRLDRPSAEVILWV